MKKHIQSFKSPLLSVNEDDAKATQSKLFDPEELKKLH